jgi:uncharacterized membrane protein YtjA (UPF0391 family)
MGLIADEQLLTTSLTLRQALHKECRNKGYCPRTQGIVMLHYTVVFLVIALIAAVFGFGGIAAGAVEIAKILFFIFAILAIVSFVAGLMRRK